MPFIFVGIIVLVCVFGFWNTISGILLGMLALLSLPFIIIGGIILAVIFVGLAAMLLDKMFK